MTTARRLMPFSAAAWAVTAGLWWWLIASGADLGGGSWLLLSALVLAFLLAESAQVHVEVRAQTLSLSMSELPLVLGLFLVGPIALLLSRLSAAAAVSAHRRTSVFKSAFNLSLFAAETTALIALWERFGLTGRSGLDIPWLTSAALVVGVTLLGLLYIVLAMWRLQGRVDRRQAGLMMLTTGISATLNASAALCILLVARSDATALPLVIVLMVVAVLAYYGYSRLMRRHRTLGEMAAFSRDLSAALGSTNLRQEILAATRRLLNSGTAVLVEVASTSAGRARTSDVGSASDREEGELSLLLLAGDGPARPAPELGDGPVAQVLATGEPQLIEAGGRDAWLDRHGLRDAALVPLRAGEDVVGVLAVGGRLGETSSFTRDDVALLQLAGAQISTALRHGRLVDRLRHEARHDGLTGLPNRFFFHERLAEMLAVAGTSCAVLMLDLDGFKEINDTLGHASGDGLLREVGDRLRSAAPSGAMVARLGGDEFAVLLPRDAGFDAERAATGMQAALSRAMVVDGLDLQVRASLGLSLSPEHGRDADLLLQHADLAMYRAKDRRLGWQLFDEQLDQTDPQRLSLLAHLDTALEREELICHYQPQVDTVSGELVGFEALVRWDHPLRGLVPPDEFIGLAERTGLIVPLTRCVLDLALARCAVWRASVPDLVMAVNLSPRALLEPGLVQDVRAGLASHGLPSAALCLEVTESSVMADPERAIVVLRELRSLGVRLSVDDFGTGYSSLAYLQQLPVHEVKVDKSFVLRLGHQAGSSAIVQAVIDLGHALELTVVAEGVEDVDALDALRGLGCDVVQGYLVSRPGPPEAFTSLVAHGQFPLPRTAESWRGPLRVIR